MTSQHETLETLTAQLQQLREAIAQQQDTIAQQQAQLQALQARLETEAAAGAGPVADPAGYSAAVQGKRSTKTSRRRLLTTAGAAAAAATAAVALGQGEVAHAATGSNLVLGQSNNAGATTSLTPSVSTSPSPLLTVTASGFANIAIEGDGTGGAIGVKGTSDSSVGVFGGSTSDIGVQGFSNNSLGVWGKSTSGVGGFFQGGLAPISLAIGGTPGAPTTGLHNAGDIYLDSAATLWVCTNNGTPGTWVRLANVANGATGGTTTYLTAPVRLLDARSGATSGLVNRGPLTANEIYALSVAGLAGSGIPAGALGLICNVTVLGPSQNGNLSLFPTGAPIPTTASMTFVAGAFLANHVSAALGGGKVNIQNQSGGNTPLVVDAVGFIM